MTCKPRRTCGAACLSMVYQLAAARKFRSGLIWPRIAKKNIYGSIASTTHLMAADAVIPRVRRPWRFRLAHPLQGTCAFAGTPAFAPFMNHRLQPDSPAGHYTVFVDIDDTVV